MQWFDRLPLKAKLVGSFLIVSALCGIVGALGVFSLARLSGETDKMYTRELRGLQAVQQADISLLYASRAQIALLSASTVSERKSGVKQIEDGLNTMQAEIAASRPSCMVGAAGRAMIQEFETLSGPLQQRFLDFAKLLTQQPLDATMFDGAVFESSDQLLKDTKALEEVLSRMVARRAGFAKTAMENADQTYQTARLIMVSLVAASVLLSIGLGLFLARVVGRQLGGEPAYASEIARRIAGGDLTVQVNVREQDRSSLLYAMQQMQQQLSQTVGNIKLSADSIASATQEIAAGNTDLSQRTEEQASSLEETASSMEQLTSIVRQNADNARQASGLAVNASDIASKGGAVVHQVVGTMADINDSSRKIVDIIGVIEGIAFQTNILALNAAVEAARAGEQGRGFAVVAGEVRSLAQRSADAAKEIKALINDSVSRVENGTQLVDQAGRTMDEIVEAVKRVTDIMGEISAASEEQSSGIEQVNQAVTQMDQVTQQNAALVEEAAAAAESLNEQSARLKDAIAAFRIDRHAVTHTVSGTETVSGTRQAGSAALARKVVAKAQATAKPAPAAIAPAAAAASPVPAAPPTPAATTVAAPAAKPRALKLASTADDEEWTSF